MGAYVVAITSSQERSEKLLSLGAHRVYNYNEKPKWGLEARGITPASRGFDHIIDIGGMKTLPESLQAVRLDGVLSLVGTVGGPMKAEDGPSALSPLMHICICRGLLLGTRVMLRDMIDWFEKNDVKPALDSVQFKLEDARHAYERLEKQEHFSKIIITMK
jgi:D-arabinose 1-dehydrogenase-like Zn-dependent alcohol dehydrogenase